ncbi:MAG: DUF1002 domain-containing protein [Methanobrevibacter sp.]|nr:DUF1002 domain-containing protein [Methanobrevibacter sp.]
MRKSNICIILLSIIIVGILIPVGFSSNDKLIVITYGETTQHNSNYKSTVDEFFKQQSNLDPNNINSKIITANDVNKISKSITGKTYTSDPVFSSALVNLKDNKDLKVSVDKSKITTITGEMYLSALKSAGIKSGHVYVTSPVTATGESALAGIMNSYEEATNVKIPETVKEAANDEIFTQAEIVENSKVNSDDLSKLVDNVKQTVKENNITDHKTIVNVINNYTKNNNINMSNNDIENLATSIEKIQNAQGDVNNYESQVSTSINGSSSNSENNLLGGIFN